MRAAAVTFWPRPSCSASSELTGAWRRELETRPANHRQTLLALNLHSLNQLYFVLKHKLLFTNHAARFYLCIYLYIYIYQMLYIYI